MVIHFVKDLLMPRKPRLEATTNLSGSCSASSRRESDVKPGTNTFDNILAKPAQCKSLCQIIHMSKGSEVCM